METERIQREQDQERVRDRTAAPAASAPLLRKFLTVLLLILGDLLGWAGGLIMAVLLVAVVTAVPMAAAILMIFQLWWFALLGLAFLAWGGLYTRRRPFWDEMRSLWGATTLAHVAALPAFILQGDPSHPPALLLFSWPMLLVSLPLLRRVVKTALGRVGLWRKRTLVLGAGHAAQATLAPLTEDPVLGYEVVGLLDEPSSADRSDSTSIETNGRSFPLLGPLNRVEAALARSGCRDVVIALPDLSQATVLELIPRLQAHPQVESVKVVPDIGYLALMDVQVDHFLPERLFMVTVSDNLAKPWNLMAKRAFDLVFGSLLLLLAAPVIAVFAWLIRRDTPGPAFYIHDRLGQGGQTFRCYKFRTMHLDGDERLRDAIEEDPNARWEWEVYRKLKLNDPRITPVGRVLRRWSLDELPQLINVLKGEMSLIGPRPYLPEEREEAGAELGTILQARPGITGLWQVSGKNAIPFEERVRMEAWYVRNWSFWLDAMITIRTVRVIVQEEVVY